MSSRQYHKNGFSLIELAIVMLITGVLMSGFLQFYTVSQQQKRYTVTKQRLVDIRTALTNYVIEHGHLPCPAGPTGDYSEDQCAHGKNPMQGVESFDVDTKDMGGNAQNEVWIGILPMRELRFDREQVQDGWGDDFTYAVSRRLTLPNGMIGNPLPFGVISVVDEKGESVLDKPHTSRYVVVSHGPTGAGAWLPSGGRKPCNTDTLDGRNCIDKNIFVVAPVSTQKGKRFYDDIVIHDDINAGGPLVDKLAVCSAKQGFYAPSNRYADRDGCILSRSRLH
ncbi:MAG: prepilin-type N-terminal cleavage/methylation domain-containing protein [Alphaproteobacteria bacterium]|nr:prepilin-type N-terminal cleavage/methylation domain-containing protein [Alphaproteobacteria bacterium]